MTRSQRRGFAGAALHEEFQLLTGHSTRILSGPTAGPDLLFSSVFSDGPEERVVRELGDAVDTCLAGPHGGPNTASPVAAQPLVKNVAFSPSMGSPAAMPGAYGHHATPEVAGVELDEEAPPQSTARVTADKLISALKKPLAQPILPTTPKARVTRSERARERGDAELVPKRSARLAAKSKSRAPKPEAQARKVMMKRLGVEVEMESPDEASFDVFQMAFKLPVCRFCFPVGSSGCLSPHVHVANPGSVMLGTNVFIWNVRGLNSWARRDVVREFLVQECVSVVCLVETKIDRGLVP